jgi:hypothetical protein
MFTIWKLQVTLAEGKNNAMDTGTFFEWTLILHGTKTAPYDNQVSDEENHNKLFMTTIIVSQKPTFTLK